MSKTTAIEICAHKFFAPPEFDGAVRRDVILDRIFAGRNLRVILVQGPAGHGKSTLLQQAKSTCEAQGTLTGWLSFDDADNDPRRLFLHLQALLASVKRVESLAGLPEIEDGGVIGAWRPVDWFIGGLIETGRPVALFFDEFQTLRERGVLGFFREMLERVPESVRIFIGSRSVPEIGLARLVVNNQATVLRTDDLRFSLAEAGRFFAAVPDLKIQEAETEAMFRQTEGWPAALQLFRLSLVSPSVRRGLPELAGFRLPQLAEYLADNVMGLQTPDVQEFLRRTSPLTRLSASLCDTVTGGRHSQDMLLFLERSGLFLRSLDPEKCWFRLHSLFSNFLMEQLRQTSEDAVLEVHRRAMDWYRAEEIYEEAMHHAVAAREWRQAADIMDVWASRLIAEGHLTTVERWCDRLPLDEIERRPDLAVKIAWALTFLRRQPKLAPILPILARYGEAERPAGATNPRIVLAMVAIMEDDLQRSFDTVRAVDMHAGNPQGFCAFEMGAAANLLGYHAVAACDFENANELLTMSRVYSERAQSIFSLGYALANKGVGLLVQGRLGEALGCFRSGINDPRLHQPGSVAGASLVACTVQALYEANEIDSAETHFTEFREMITQGTLLDYLAVAYVAMARIQDLRGRPDHGAALLDEAESIGFANAWPRLVRTIKWERIRRLLLAGDADRAQSLASRIRGAGSGLSEGWVPFAEDTAGDAIGRARLAVHAGRTDDGLREIGRQLTIAQRTGRLRRQMTLHTLEAVAYQRKGAGEVAGRYLLRALRLAERPGFVRPILDEGDLVVPLLQKIYQDLPPEEDAFKGFVARLLDASGIDLRRAEARGSFEPLEPLTRREVDILVFLDNGVSNKEIARRIFISENTVKFHLKNVYSKLGVTSRLQAISAARRMGLI